MANAIQNDKADSAKLFVSNIKVDGGPMLKRWMPRARGASSMIQKKTSHISIALASSDKISDFNFVFPEKKRKIKPIKPAKTRVSETAKEKRSVEDADKAKKTVPGKSPGLFQEKSSGSAQSKKNFMKRIFRRKSI